MPLKIRGKRKNTAASFRSPTKATEGLCLSIDVVRKTIERENERVVGWFMGGKKEKRKKIEDGRKSNGRRRGGGAGK